MPTPAEASWIDELAAVWSQAVDIWLSGGWAMWAIAVIALLMFGMGVHVHLALRTKGFLSVPESVWRRWIDRPMDREGPIGELLDFVTGARTLEDAAISFEQLQVSEAAPFERDLKVMKVCVSAAPLVGLLGTVTGMLATFGALSSGSGGDKTMAMIADGISEALITTETGLVIALPGLFFQYQLNRGFQAYTAFLAHLESVCNQTLYRELRESRDRDVRREAQREIAARLRELRSAPTA
ncbi:MAG: MotA/TolQ/ExbB proton channel family protein [Planctomycetota bacterium]|nr:MotA/TolQ/ExbB proton channel family protein [Planctomycetota bacterium]MDA0932139.1 MotA/TolQ/ExbB proton channel family protein [Planctomycetota bacterium]MDA1220407.1 MotA/TolQ/ExbB proton channel family protein [Planctomycetota bacterium]